MRLASLVAVKGGDGYEYLLPIHMRSRGPHCEHQRDCDHCKRILERSKYNSEHTNKIYNDKAPQVHILHSLLFSTFYTFPRLPLGVILMLSSKPPLLWPLLLPGGRGIGDCVAALGMSSGNALLSSANPSMPSTPPDWIPMGTPPALPVCRVRSVQSQECLCAECAAQHIAD